jgi:hypothetical protein
VVSPPRPEAIPTDAAWSVQTDEWELVPRDPKGKPEGLARAWRADGTLSGEYEYRAGERHGTFKRFHPDGSIAREGLYVAGQQHGTMIAHGYDGPGMTPEPLQSCCVPPGAWQLQNDFEHGRLVEVRWYDRSGIHILRSGAPHPPRPESVPREASFDESSDRWVRAIPSSAGNPDGAWLRWARDGVLRERDECRGGKAHGLCQRFDAAGNLTEESEWCGGCRSGRYRRIGVPADVYVDARVHEERGAFDRDQAVGSWSLLDAAGTQLHTFELGAVLDDERLRGSPALADAAPSATTETWLGVARDMEGARRPAEAILATARAAAASAEGAPLRAILERLALPQKTTNALNTATGLVARAEGRLDLIANGVLLGGDAVSLLRALAASLTGRERVALDLVDAALLLAPDRDDCLVTRALLNIHIGRPDAARADAASLPARFAEQRAFLDGYVQIIFGAFPFAPARTEIRTRFPDVPKGPEQPLEKVREQIQKYATRLGLLRAAVLARLPPGAPPAWSPPDATNLLPVGPVELESWEFEEIVEDGPDKAVSGAPTEPTLVTVDETLTIDSAASLPALICSARRDWNGLCWLCWGAGLDRVALPDTIEAPADFGLAAGMSVEHFWRCRDQIITGGLRAMTQGVPSFHWEGFEIDQLPLVLAEIAAAELREMRAVFYWLCDAGIQSPWQDNVRTAD